MNQDENEQKDYSSRDVRKEARRQQDKKFYEANKNTLNTAASFNPYVAAINEADKKSGRLGTKMVSKSPIKYLPESQTFANIGGSKFGKTAGNIVSTVKGKNGDAAKNAASNAVKDNAEKTGETVSSGASSQADDLKNKVDKNKQKNTNENISREKAKEKAREREKDSLEEEEEENRSSDYSPNFQEDVKKEQKKSAIINGLITIFGGTPMVVTAVTIGIVILLVGIIFFGIYTAVEETEGNLKADATGHISSTVILSNLGDPFAKQDGWKLYNFVKAIKEGTLMDDIKSAVNKIKNKFADKYDLFTNLGNIFSSETECSGDDCKSRAEVQFYEKVSLITERYKKVYNVELDWPLLVSTIVANSDDKEKTFAENLGGYDTKDLDNVKKVTSLDWEYDYKNIAGYDYLSGNDSRYDLQILAKNMVKKTVTQTCKDAKGVDLVEPLVLEDVEDSLIDPKLNNGYYLKCPAGGKYNIETPVYKIDKEKYDEFLDEYLEMKYFENVNGGSGSSNGSGSSTGTGNTINISGNFSYPLSGNIRINSDFGYRSSGYHCGIDFYANEGTPVYAMADGVVSNYCDGQCNASEGRYVYIDHGNGIHISYMHASKVVVKTGDTVKRGQLIMYSGSTGRASGPHLHIGMKVSGQSDEHCSNGWVNPWSYLGRS